MDVRSRHFVEFDTRMKERDEKKSDLILSFNKLQNTLIASGHKIDISLPRIIVVGCQSAGKSSVLERFVQREFLPRGNNLVTRRPIVIQLVPSSEEYGTFLHREDKFTDFSAIRDEIIRETDEECEPQEFSKKPISLTIYSPKVLKLTVVDLPGIIRVPTGKQTAETVNMSHEIVMEYIKDPQSIILAITPANQQLSNSEAMEFARTVDPDGKRTIGVLTKVDKSELGTDGRDILENKLRPLERGWVGVKNRNGDETDNNKDMEAINKEESEFFKKDPLYKHLAHRMGVPYLQRLLHKTLKTHIKECLPDLRKDISDKLFKLERELLEYDTIIGEGSNYRQKHMTDLIQKFCEDVTVKIMGHSEKVPSNTLTHGALMNFQFHNEVQKLISQVNYPNEDEIIYVIQNTGGLRDSISVPSLAVFSSCKRLITRFEEPLYASVECIKQVLLDAVEESGEILSVYPDLKTELLYKIQSWVEKKSEDTKDRFKSHINAEIFYINIGHPDFDSSTCDPIVPPTGPVNVWSVLEENKDESANKKKHQKKLLGCDPIAPPTGPVKVWRMLEENKDESANQNKDIKHLTELLKANPVMQQQVKYITALVVKYLEIVQKQLSDVAVKYIAYFMVQKVLHYINHDLINVVFDSAKILSLIEDNTEDIETREELKKTCKTLRDALDAIRAF